MIVLAAAGLAGRALLSPGSSPIASPTVTRPTSTPPGSPTPATDPEFFFSGRVTSDDPLPPTLTGDECVVVTKVGIQGPVSFALEPGYHLRPEANGPYNCNIADNTPSGRWNTCEAYDNATEKIVHRLPPGRYELVATGKDVAGKVHTARVDVHIAEC